MKKTIKKTILFGFLVSAMFSFVSCGSKSRNEISSAASTSVISKIDISSNETSTSKINSSSVSSKTEAISTSENTTNPNTSKPTETSETEAISTSENTTNPNTSKPTETSETISSTVDDKIEYTVTFDSKGGTNVESQTIEEGNKINKPENPTKKGYTFSTWTYNQEEWDFNVDIVTDNIILEAIWSPNTNTAYKVEHYLQNINNNNYPTTPYETDNLTGTTDTQTNASVKTYEGFTSPSITQVNINGDGSTVIKLYYDRISYTFNATSNDTTVGTVTGSGSYKYGAQVTIAATEPKLGYVFTGWYDGTTKVSAENKYTFNMPSNNLSLEARYQKKKYKITLINQITGSTITGITSGESYEYKSEINLSISSITSEYTIKWIRSDGYEYYGKEISFNVPAGNITITVNQIPYTRANNKIYFGSYPQTKVTDNTLISSLNERTGALPTETQLGNWTDYNYFNATNVTSYMYYQDIDYDNDGDYDYRGVYFTKYRPSYYSYNAVTTSTSNDNYYQDDNDYNLGVLYWFSFDPIEWNILAESEGKALIIANLLLDCQEYYPSNSDKKKEHNGGTGFSNNYALSDIRKWLNDNFYNTAFIALEKAIIAITEVDNSAETTVSSSNKYACESTNDNIFLLSYSEANDYSTLERSASGTDYAKCQGLRVMSSGYSNWWTRSPSSSSAYSAYYITSPGDLASSYNGYINGIRPVCWITL
ncbi:MAG: DUF6273 domain-containing protein [Acholeplasmatales bacterium]|nr:DUF6273 domain-containing protein [Acholeplasmatales bacterium]